MGDKKKQIIMMKGMGNCSILVKMKPPRHKVSF